MFIMLLLGIAVLPVAFLYLYHSGDEGYYAKNFGIKITDLQHQFKNQNGILWNVVRKLGNEHIAKSFSKSSYGPKRPLVFLLVSTPDNSEELDCLSRSIAKAFLNTGNYSVFDGNDVAKTKQLKPDLDEDMERTIRSSPAPHVLLFKDLGSLPYDIASLLFKYCDNEGAPYPRTVFIFTLTLDGDNNILLKSSKKEIDAKSNEYLSTIAWKDGEKAKTDALIARIVNPFPLAVMKEESSVLKEVC